MTIVTLVSVSNARDHRELTQRIGGVSIVRRIDDALDDVRVTFSYQQSLGWTTMQELAFRCR